MSKPAMEPRRLSFPWSTKSKSGPPDLLTISPSLSSEHGVVAQSMPRYHFRLCHNWRWGLAVGSLFMRLTEILKPENVLVPMKATTKNAAIEELVNLLAKNG